MAKDREHWHTPLGTAAPRTGSPTPSGPTTAARQGYARWWSSRSVIWPTPGRYAAGGAGSTASGTSSALPRRWSASAGGCTESPHDRARRTPSMPSGCATCSRAACRRRLVGVRLDVTTWPRCDAESTCRSVLAVNAPTSGTRHGGAWHDAWPAELLDPQPGVEGSYAGWLGAPRLLKPAPTSTDGRWRRNRQLDSLRTCSPIPAVVDSSVHRRRHGSGRWALVLPVSEL
jgi:hypothetical protein